MGCDYIPITEEMLGIVNGPNQLQLPDKLLIYYSAYSAGPFVILKNWQWLLPVVSLPPSVE